jgi:CheY-like chemotaxis protein
MKKILVIEDERNIRASIVEILQLYSYNVVDATNGKDGLMKALTENPDLIICDVMMPEMNGFAVLEELNRNPDFKTPFIFLTAKAQSDDMRNGMDLKAVGYIFKPFKAADLIKIIEDTFLKTIN